MTERDEEETKKVTAERIVLELQASRRFQRREDIKALAGLAGVLAAIVAIGGLLFSWDSSQQQEALDREVRIDTRLDRAFERLASTSSADRMSAVTVLQSFLPEQKYSRDSLILMTLTNALSIEDDPMVRNYIVRALTATDRELIAETSQREALENLIDISRALVVEGDLKNSRRLAARLPARGGLEVRAHNVAQAIVGMMRSGAVTKDLSRSYLVESDFSRMDLSGVDFSDAVLSYSRFIATVCRSCVFDGADIEDVRFNHAVLDGSKFTVTEAPGAGQSRSSYVFNLLARGKDEFNGPDFSQSSLVDADFTGHHLFGLRKDDEFRDAIGIGLPRFHKTTLTRTDFRNISIYTVSDSSSTVEK